MNYRKEQQKGIERKKSDKPRNGARSSGSSNESDRSGHFKSYRHPQHKSRTRQLSSKEDSSSTKDVNSDEERLRQRRERFLSKPLLGENDYGLVSRGEDTRLQKSSRLRQEFFNEILASFLQYNRENSSAQINVDVSQFIENGGVETSSQDAGDRKTPSIAHNLMSLRKLREALLSTNANRFTKNVYLCSVRISSVIGHYQTYVPSILYLLEDKHQHLLSDSERQEIATLLVLHEAHFTHDNVKALKLYFEHLDGVDTKTLQILDAWIAKDYYTWIRLYNTETDAAKVVIMKLGLRLMVQHINWCFKLSYYTFSLKDFVNLYLPSGFGITDFIDLYKLDWKIAGENLMIKERGNVK